MLCKADQEKETVLIDTFGWCAEEPYTLTNRHELMLIFVWRVRNAGAIEVTWQDSTLRILFTPIVDWMFALSTTDNSREVCSCTVYNMVGHRDLRWENDRSKRLRPDCVVKYMTS